MLIWNKKLYFGDGVKKKHRKHIHAINHGKLAIGVYCITFASCTDDLFDIIAAKELLFPAYQHMDIHILGLASGRDEAILVAVDMLMEIYQATGEFKVREYFNNS